MSEKAKTIASPSVEQEQMAVLLNELSGESFMCKPKKNSNYLSLDIQVGKSKNNKNAVSVCRKYVSLMVADWTRVEEAQLLGFIPELFKERLDLRFHGLTSDRVKANVSFFQDMLKEAEKASRSRQGVSH